MADPLVSAGFKDTNDLGTCQLKVAPTTGGGCPSCSSSGMPRWWVSEPYMNLWMADEPLSYTMSSGQQMVFRFTYHNRAALPDPISQRAYDILPLPVVSCRLDQRTVSATYNIMTNAVWCHNWWSEIVYWDPTLENNATAPTGPVLVPPLPQAPTNAFFPMSLSYVGFVLSGDGGLIAFDRNTISSASGSMKVRVLFLGQPSGNGGPEVQVSTNESSVYNYPTNSQGIVWVSSPQYGFEVLYPDGSTDVYGLVFLDHPLPGGSLLSAYRCPAGHNCYGLPNNTSRAFLTQHIDPQGRVTSLGYQLVAATPAYVLRYITDPDGKTTTYSYVQGNNYELAQLQDPYGRTASFGYDGNTQMLTNIVDAAGNSNSIQYLPPQVNGRVYNYDGWISNLVTSYGTNWFEYYQEQEATATNEYEQRAVFASEPQSACQLFLFQQNCTNIESASLSSGVPSVNGWAFDNGTSTSSGTTAALQYRNTYVWGRQQFADMVPQANLPAWLRPGSLGAALTFLTPANYREAHLKHWLLDSTDPNGIDISDWISSERDPSRDSAGQTQEARTWYSYIGQSSGQYESGNEPLIGCIARSLPDGSSQYQCRTYGANGNLLNQRLSYSRADGSTGELTNSFTYSTDGIDLLSVTNSAGQWVNLAYSSHLPVNVTNALNQVTALGYNGNFNLSSVALPSGQTVALSAQNHAPPSQIVFQPQNRTNNIPAYSAGLPQIVQVSGPGVPDLWFTNTWDGLNRLTGTAFQDGSTISNIYTRVLGSVLRGILLVRPLVTWRVNFERELCRRQTCRCR